jgi:hypothetical protein
VGPTTEFSGRDPRAQAKPRPHPETDNRRSSSDGH